MSNHFIAAQYTFHELPTPVDCLKLLEVTLLSDPLGLRWFR